MVNSKSPFWLLGAIWLSAALLSGLCVAFSGLAPGARPTFTATPAAVTEMAATSTRTATARPPTFQATRFPGLASLSPGANGLLGTGMVTATLIAYPTFTVGPLGMGSWCIPWNTASVQTRVERVIDAVTVEVHLNNELYQVRYIGIAAPEEAAASQAAAKNRELVEGKIVLLVEDHFPVDDEGRLLRYVVAGPTFVNLALVESGYAVADSLPPNLSCDPAFQEAEALARAAGRGLWASTPTPTRSPHPPTSTVSTTGDAKITHLFYDGEHWQEADEFVEIRNTSAWPIQMQGWQLKDLENHTFTFPSMVLESGGYCRIYTNMYLTGICNLGFGSLAPIWDNKGDCAYLYNERGELVDQFCYE
ncbi:MAG: lamin tail domain-containing protein [Chloroflexota bacterium]